MIYTTPIQRAGKQRRPSHHSRPFRTHAFSRLLSSSTPKHSREEKKRKETVIYRRHEGKKRDGYIPPTRRQVCLAAEKGTAPEPQRNNLPSAWVLAVSFLYARLEASNWLVERACAKMPAIMVKHLATLYHTYHTSTADRVDLLTL